MRYGKWPGIVSAVLVVVVLAALPSLAVLSIQQNDRVSCQRDYLSRLAAALTARAEEADQESVAQLSEMQALLADPSDSGAVAAARQAYAKALSRIAAYQLAHPVPAVPPCG